MLKERSRGVTFTYFNYNEETITNIQNFAKKECTYLVYGEEICPETRKSHLQGYMYFKNARYLKAITEMPLWKGVHIEKARFDFEAAEYCKEDGKWWEYGTQPKQGTRTDFLAICEMLKNEEVTVDDIAMEHPMMFHQYGRTFDKIANVVAKRRVNNKRETKGIWYFGDTNTGKSHRAMGNLKPEDYYVWADDEDWWDGYEGQKTVVIDEFRGEIKFSRLLRLCDKWSASVRRRGLIPLPFTSETLIVTSAMHPRDVFKNLDKQDKWEQFFRRFTVVECLSHDTEVVRGNTSSDWKTS
jgi:Circovirus replication-associated protein